MYHMHIGTIDFFIRSIGIAFVTFAQLSDAKQVNKDHHVRFHCISTPPTSTLSNIIQPENWSVRFAPPPEDIYWENLTDTHRLFFVKALLINLLLFVVLFFFTSPAYIISQIELIITFKSFTPSEKVSFTTYSLCCTLIVLYTFVDVLNGFCSDDVLTLPV